jgi:hypothetical protein
MRNHTKIAAAFASLGALLFCGEALAKAAHHRSHRHHAPLEVSRRSFLDPGTKVPVGSTQGYMVYETFFHQDPVSANQRSWYMNETLPHHLDQPWAPGLPIDF